MSVATVSTSSLFAGSSDSSTRVPQKTLSQDDFLKLLIVQLTSQDPLKPLEDTEFMSQMTQFSTLEQTKAMESEIAQMRADQELMRAAALIGRAVDVFTDTGTVSGTVASINITSGTPQIVVNGQSYALSSILRVAPAETQEGVSQ